MPEREFLGWDEPALPLAARRLAEAHAAGEPRLDDVLLVLPAARAGRRLRELLLEEAEGRGTHLPPPRAVTVGKLPELLYEPEVPPAGDLLARRVWAEALRSVEGDRLEAVFPRPPGEDDLGGWHRLGQVVAGLHREVGREGLTFGDVAGTCAERFGRREGRRWDALARAREAYLGRLGELGRGDRQVQRARALEGGRVSAPREIEAVWLLGVVELPGLTRRMLEALEVPVRALVHAPADRADAFDELGLVRPGRWREEELDLPEPTVCGGPPEQAEAALAALSGEGPPLAPDAVTVGVPNDEVVAHLERRLEERDVPHRYAAGTPLAETRPYRLLEAVAEFLDGRRFADLAALLRHPDLTDRLDVPLEALDQYHAEHLPRGTDDFPLGAASGAGELRRMRDALREDAGLAGLEGRRSLGGWMPEVLSVLEKVYGERDLDRSRPADRRLLEACGRIAAAAEAVARLPAEASPRCAAAAALRLLLGELREETIPPEPERPAVELLGWLELHLDDAPALVVTGLDDESVPGGAGGDPFLPDGLRTELGLPDDGSRHGRDAYLLAASVRPRDEAHLVVGREGSEGDPLRPSRLLLSADGEELARTVERLFRERERSVRPARTDPGDGGAGGFASPPEPVIRVDEPPERLRVTDFRSLLDDPYRFALERLLGLQSVDDRARELDGGAFGSLAHRVLHRFGAGPGAEEADPGGVDERLQALLDEEVERRFGDDTFPAVRLQVEQLRRRLREFARWQAGRVAAGWRIAAVEAEPEGGGVPFEVDGEPVLLSGRIDRIDVHEERGEWQLLDYKTGESARSPEKEHRKGRGEEKRWVDLQLPLYRHLLPGVASLEGVPSAPGEPGLGPELGYVRLSREGVEPSMADWSEAELREADEAAREAVRTLRRGVFRHRPGERRTFRGDPLDVLFRAEGPPPGSGRDDEGEGERT